MIRLDNEVGGVVRVVVTGDTNEMGADASSKVVALSKI